ncbi:MAG: sigma-54 dependent transcriptional regulator [candidate division KSB1 bacterium]|nr:sigma-54 dependent transcriptional regulator [candidate division KSB1 bacterium]MDZ7302922.1 sigma-54 dependent transcriptional regulator [candidate division KSB1 bacterium]MDZ7310497.1 sigma-54 dependent transcriptional regulator [candidate division KSB1 bacterium]
MTKILILDDDRELCELLRDALENTNYKAQIATSAAAGMAKLQTEAFDILLLDIRLDSVDGLSLLPEIFAKAPELKVVMITSHGTIPLAVQALKSGAYHFIEKPINLDTLLHVLKQAEEHSALVRTNRLLREQLCNARGKLVATSPLMQRLVEKMQRVAITDATILLCGDTGTGKELVAHTIHQLSPRATQPFVAINCAALPENLVASELFGHERGAFTGAITMKKGKLEMAHAGTALLDEIGDMPLPTQAHFLRFLEDKKFERLGGVKSLEADVRIIAATNQNLPALVAERKFREDLFYRLNTVTLHLPPLRERREDLPELVQHFLQVCAAKLNRAVPKLSDEAWQLLQRYEFPGNVRELHHIIESAVIETPRRDCLTAEDILPLLNSGNDHLHPAIDSAVKLYEAVDGFKREYIQKILAAHNGNKTRAAKALGISRVHLLTLVKELGVVRGE